MYWIVVDVNESIGMKELKDMIENAVIEYYGISG
jgi:hypothetical protein